MKFLSVCTLVLVLLIGAAFAQETSSYVAHVGSFRSLESARKGLDELNAKVPQLLQDAKPHIHTVELGEKGTWYRLQLGPPSTHAAMARFCERLTQTGHSYCKVM